MQFCKFVLFYSSVIPVEPPAPQNVAHYCIWLPNGDQVAVMSISINYAFLSTCGFFFDRVALRSVDL